MDKLAKVNRLLILLYYTQTGQSHELTEFVGRSSFSASADLEEAPPRPFAARSVDIQDVITD